MAKYEGIQPNRASITITLKHGPRRFKKTLKMSPTAENQRYCSRQRTLWLDKLCKGERVAELEGDKPTVEDYLKLCFDTNFRNSLKATTHHDYKNAIAFWSEVFSDLAIEDLTIGMVRDECAKMDVTSKTIGNRLIMLRKAVKRAFEDGVIPRDFLVTWKPTVIDTRYDDEEYEDSRNAVIVDPFTLDEQRAIISAAQDQPSIANLYQFAFWSGLRISELVALRWQDVDFDAGLIRVRKAKTQAARKLERTKTRKSKGNVEMLKHARDALMRQRKHSQLKSEFVFLDPATGEPFPGDEDLREDYWKPLLEKAGVRYRYQRQTRHTFATMMIKLGEEHGWISHQLRHAKLSTLYEHYATYLNEKKEGEDKPGSKANSITL